MNKTDLIIDANQTLKRAAHEIRRLNGINQELVEELIELLSWQSLAPEHVVLSAKTVLAKAIGEQP